jgi:hypothetical protein
MAGLGLSWMASIGMQRPDIREPGEPALLPRAPTSGLCNWGGCIRMIIGTVCYQEYDE